MSVIMKAQCLYQCTLTVEMARPVLFCRALITCSWSLKYPPEIL